MRYTKTDTIRIGASVDWACEHIANGCTVRPLPDNFTACGPAARSVRQGDIMLDQIAHDAVNAATALEDIEDEPDRLPHPLIRIEADLTGWALEVATRHVEAKFAAFCLVPAPLIEAGAHDVQLCFGHRSFEPEQQAVVVESGIIDAVAVSNQRACQRADLQQLIPIAARAGETRDLIS